MKKFAFFWLFISLLAFSPVTWAAPASSPVPLDSWVYPALDKLAGLGLINSSLRGMRPYTRLEAARQVREVEEQNTAGRAAPVVQELLARLEAELEGELRRLREAGEERSFFKPLRTTEFSYVYRDGALVDIAGNNARQFPPNHNNFGIEYGKGHNTQLTFESEANFGGWLSLSARPLYEIQEDGADGSLHLLEGRAALGLGPFEFSAGRQALWWGQGRHGTLVMSNNARPLDMIRVTNPSPVLLPWIFKYLGPFRFDLFVSELEDERVVPEPYFSGLRVAFKPVPWFEFGAMRNITFGGEGRPDIDFGDFLTILSGRNLSGDEDTSNSVAAISWRLKIPFLWGAEFYGEKGGEDLGGDHLFEKSWSLGDKANLYALYLPRIEPSGRLSLRLEYTDITDPVWYRHGIYRSGYTYKRRVMGHHYGGDAEGVYGEIQAFLPHAFTLTAGFDYQQRGIHQAVEEEHRMPSLLLEWAANEQLRLEARYALDRVENFAFVEGDDRDFHFTEISLRYLW